MGLPTPRPNLVPLRPYQAAGGITPKYNLSANESCLGPSPSAVRAASEAVRNLATYPDGGSCPLRAAIAARYRLDRDRIVCGAGSEELISLIVQAWVAPGETVLFSEHGFVKYELSARAYGAHPLRAVETAYTADVGALLDAVTPDTRVVFLANPNNPTGTYLPDREVRRLRAGLREDVLLVIDSAYAEYVTRDDYTDGSGLAGETGNTLMLRTFSKIHGLAGLRVGWTYGAPVLVEALNKVRGVFNVNVVAQAAAAAAVLDVEHERHAREHNAQWLPWLSHQLDALGLSVVPGVGNFVMVRFPSAHHCRLANEALSASGILVMPLAGYRMPEAMRITVGSAAANEAVIGILKGHLRGVRKTQARS